MDSVDKKTRSRIMSSVGRKDTAPEMELRRSLHKIGLRYRLHDKRLAGSPDIVFPRFEAVVFVHGCFWHRHGCKATTTPATNVAFWREKFDANVARDRRDIAILRHAGWRVAVVWQCSLKGQGSDPDAVAEFLREWLLSGEKRRIVPRGVDLWPPFREFLSPSDK